MKIKILLLVLIFSFRTAPAQESTASKSISTFSIASPELQATKKIWIYLPENYKNSKKKYPVFYMHDAQNLFDEKTSFVGEWNVDEKLDSLRAQVIVVGIENGNEKRIDELTPYSNEKHGGGNGEKYADFIVKTLKPYVDSHYRTKTTAKNTTIMGSSLGGLISMYAVLKYPETFGKAAVFSPSFWFSDKIYNLATASPKLKTKIYFLCGDHEGEDMVADLQKMKTLLLENKVITPKHMETKIIKKGEHNEKLWRDGLVQSFLWLEKFQ